MGIHLLDHIIIGDNNYTSLKEKAIYVITIKRVHIMHGQTCLTVWIDIGTSNFKMCCKDKDGYLKRKEYHRNC